MSKYSEQINLIRFCKSLNSELEYLNIQIYCFEEKRNNVSFVDFYEDYKLRPDSYIKQF